MRTVQAALAALVVATLGAASAQEGAWIADGAGLLSPADVVALDSQMTTILRDTGARTVALTVADARGEAPKAIAVRALNERRAGKRSVALVVVVQPRELYLQPGDDLAALFDEATASAICRDVVAPRMRAGDPAGALRAGLEAISARLGGRPLDVEQPGAPATLPDPQPAPGDTTGGLDACCFFPTGVAFILGLAGTIIVFASRHLHAPCPSCGLKQGPRRITTEVAATATTEGKGTRSYECRCGHAWVLPLVLPALGTSTGDTSSWSSDTGGSSGGSDTSSSSGAGGGGSSW